MLDFINIAHSNESTTIQYTIQLMKCAYMHEHMNKIFNAHLPCYTKRRGEQQQLFILDS